MANKEDSKNFNESASSIPVCDGSNNAFWRRSLEESLNSKGLFGYCDGSMNALMHTIVMHKANDSSQELMLPDFNDMFPEPQDMPEEVKQNIDQHVSEKPGYVWKFFKSTLNIEMQLKYFNESKSALAVLERSLSPTYKAKAEKLGAKRNPKAVYDTILQDFKAPSTWKLARLERRLHQEGMKDDQNPREYLKKMKALIDDASLAGITSAEKYPERLLIAGLPDRFEIIIKNMEYSSKLTYEDVVEMIEQEAEKYAEKNSYDRKRKFEISNFGEAEAGVSSSFKRNKEERDGRGRNRQVCDFCSRSGHLAEFCFINPESPKFRRERALNFVKAHPQSLVSRIINEKIHRSEVIANMVDQFEKEDQEQSPPSSFAERLGFEG
jgi:hypothetical protein